MSLQPLPLRVGAWLALGPAYSRWAPARLPWGECHVLDQSHSRLQGLRRAVNREGNCLCSLPPAEVYIGIGKPAEATACTQEAANLFPMSHNVLYMRGQVAELRGNIDEARRWYEEALSISPTHVKSMQRLVSVEQAGPPHTHMGLPLEAAGSS